MSEYANYTYVPKITTDEATTDVQNVVPAAEPEQQEKKAVVSDVNGAASPHKREKVEKNEAERMLDDLSNKKFWMGMVMSCLRNKLRNCWKKKALKT